MIRQSLLNADRAAVVTWADRGHEKIGVLIPQEVGCLLYEAFFDNEIPVITDQFKPEVFTVPTLTTKETGLGALLLQSYFQDDFDWPSVRGRVRRPGPHPRPRQSQWGGDHVARRARSDHRDRRSGEGPRRRARSPRGQATPAPARQADGQGGQEEQAA